MAVVFTSPSQHMLANLTKSPVTHVRYLRAPHKLHDRVSLFLLPYLTVMPSLYLNVLLNDYTDEISYSLRSRRIKYGYKS